MWKKLIWIFLVGLAVNLDYGSAEPKRYDNYRTYQLKPRTAVQRSMLKALDDSSDLLYIIEPIDSGRPEVNVLVAPERVANFIGILKREKIPYKLLDTNVQKSLDVEVLANNSLSEEYNWEKYQQLNATYAWMRGLAVKYPKYVQVFVVGKSYEGRDILGVRVSYEQSTNATGRRHIFIEGGIHGREWISPATATYIIHKLLTSRDKRVRKIVEEHVWHVVPHTNPDGFVHTHTTNRFWRKNRRPYGRCIGVDMNRNWDFHWMEEGSSNNSCSTQFAGSQPFSEVETRTLAEYISKRKEKLMLHLSFHSYGQKILFPYGFTGKVLPITYKNLKSVSDVAVTAFAKRYGTKYIGGTSNEAEYADSGTSTDWAYGTANIPYAYCYELRPDVVIVSWRGFVLPAKQIIPTGEETMDAVVAMVEEIDRLENLKKGNP